MKPPGSAKALIAGSLTTKKVKRAIAVLRLARRAADRATAGTR